MTDQRFSAPDLARRLLAPIAALLGLVAGLSVLILPSPAPTTAGPTQFSAERAMASINRLADEPHSVLNREAHDRARDDVIGMFADLGYTADVHSDPLFDFSIPEDKETFDMLSAEQQATVKDAPAETIVVDVQGKSERTMALMAHYDSATDSDGDRARFTTSGDSYGAADDGYGVATIVETLRALKAEGRQPENSLKIVITDAEEIGLIGARNEMHHHRADYENVDLVLNLEARGMSGPAFMFETSPNNSAVAGYFLSHVKQPVTGSLFPSLYALMPNSTDMTNLIPEGFTVLNIAAVGDADHYHQSTDAPRYVDHSTLQHYGDQVLRPTPFPADILADIFRRADIVASPSSSESFGLVALEAQASGAAVLATDADGVRFAIENHKTGLLVAPRTPQRWAVAIERLVRALVRRRHPQPAPVSAGRGCY